MGQALVSRQRTAHHAHVVPQVVQAIEQGGALAKRGAPHSKALVVRSGCQELTEESTELGLGGVSSAHWSSFRGGPVFHRQLALALEYRMGL